MEDGDDTTGSSVGRSREPDGASNGAPAPTPSEITASFRLPISTADDPLEGDADVTTTLEWSVGVVGGSQAERVTAVTRPTASVDTKRGGLTEVPRWAAR